MKVSDEGIEMIKRLFFTPAFLHGGENSIMLAPSFSHAPRKSLLRYTCFRAPFRHRLSDAIVRKLSSPRILLFCKGFLDRHPNMQPIVKAGLTNTDFSSPCCDRHGASVKSDIPVSGNILHLLKRSGPSAVFGRIPLASIDSIYRVFAGWGFAHVCKKLLKRIGPFLTDSDANRAIAFIACRVGVLASSFYMAPCAVFFRSAHAVSSSGVFAPASFCSAFFQVSGKRRKNSSAVATHKPYGVIAGLFRVSFDDCKHAKTHASEIVR